MPAKRKSASNVVAGCGGHPGIKSDGAAGRRPIRKSPPEMAQAPAAIRNFGSGIAAYVFSSASAMFSETGPVRYTASA